MPQKKQNLDIEQGIDLPESLPNLLHKTRPSTTADDRVQYVLAHDEDWVPRQRGTHEECIAKLAVLQPNPVQDALDSGGWYIVPGRIWSQLKRRARREASALMHVTKKSDPTPYQRFLKMSTNLFGSIRVLTYVPTIMTLVASANSSQYSLWTWGAWVLANATMSASIFESNGRKFDNLVLVNIGNTVMCLSTILFIAYYR